MTNFITLAAEQVKNDYFNTNPDAEFSAFKKYKKSKIYREQLEEVENQLKKEYFHSKENQKLFNVFRNPRMPSISDVYQKTKNIIEKRLRTMELGFTMNYMVFPPDVFDIGMNNYLMFSECLDNDYPLLYLYFYEDNHYKSFKEFIMNYVHDELKKSFMKLNKINEHDKEFLSKKWTVMSVPTLISGLIKTQKKEIIRKIEDYYVKEVLLSLLYENSRYMSMKAHKNYQETVMKMIKNEIPSDYAMFYPEARSLTREFVLHIGPTNSGKTYDAIQDLMNAETGVYLSPLRLLALEIQEKLNANQVACDLYTGEEQDFIPGAKHLSCTIEELSTFHYYDLAVIDEAQLIKEDQRGWAWTQAILGVYAPKVHVCMSEDAKDIVIELIKMCNDTYTIVEHKRATPLKVQSNLFRFPIDVKPHDALIVFSRKSVLQIAAELEKRGIKASVIYGALPCTVRREEVRKFINGETEVVVATDAVGMGLNLPIQRIVFLETMKFDGIRYRQLKHSEIKQIAGRAGRRGIYDIGYVATAEDIKLIKWGLRAEYKPIEKAKILFPESLLELEYPLLDILMMWQKIQDMSLFEKANIDKEIALCKFLNKNKIELDKPMLLKMIEIPFEHDDGELLYAWKSLIELYLDEKYILTHFPVPDTTSSETLEEMEKDYRVLELIYSFIRLIDYHEYDLEEIVKAKENTSEKIVAYLKENKKKLEKRCSICGKKLQWNSKYSTCKACHFKHEIA